MADDATTRHSGPNAAVAPRSSPYPTSRLAPAIDLVDTAKQIAEADQVIGTVVHAKLQVIAEQIRNLQAQAKAVLDEAVAAADLHRAECRFRKQVGAVYHLYRRPNGSLYFSMLSPDDWKGQPPHQHEGTYRLEHDMSWSPEGAAEPSSTDALRAIIASPSAG